MNMLRQVSAYEWEWDMRRVIYSVRVFPGQATLVWSNRVETSEGPQFGAGTRQTFAQFVDHGPPDDYAPPQELVAALRESIEGAGAFNPSAKRGFLARLLGR